MTKPTKKTRIRLLPLIALLLMALAGCDSNASLVGKWQKTESSLCDIVYPRRLEFFDDGTYIGSYPNWNGGQFNVVEDSRLKIDTTTGMGVYDFSVSGNTLRIRNDSGCEFTYRRADSRGF